MRKLVLSLLLVASGNGLAQADDGKPFPHIGWRGADNLAGLDFGGGAITAMKTGRAVIIVTRRICVLIPFVSTARFYNHYFFDAGFWFRIIVNTPSTAPM